MKILHLILSCLIADLALAYQAEYDANPVPAVGQNAADVRGEKDSGHPRVLFLGNSITRHGPKPSIGWTNNFGMAASSVDKDYVHVLASKIKARKPSASFALANVAGTVERKFLKGLTLEKDFGWMRDWKPDYVIIFFGANTPKTYDPEADGRFGRAVESLRNFLNADGKTRFFIVEGFYLRPALDAEKKSVAEKYGDIYVPMESVRDRPDVRGRFNHPSDNGMRLIAECLWKYLEPNLE